MGQTVLQAQVLRTERQLDPGPRGHRAGGVHRLAGHRQHAPGRVGHGGVQQVQVADERGHEGGGRLVVDLERGAHLLDAAALHDHDPVGQGQGLLLVVGDIDGGDPRGLLDGPDLGAQALADLGVQGRQGLVQEQHPRPHRQGPGQGGPLLLAAGHLVRVALAQFLHVDQGQHLVHPRGDRFRAPPGHLQAEGDVLAHGHVGEQGVVLEHHAHAPLVGGHPGDLGAADADAAGGGGFEAGDHAQGGGLAAAGTAQEGHELAFLHRQVEAVDHGGPAEPLDHATQFQECHRACPFQWVPPAAEPWPAMLRLASWMRPIRPQVRRKLRIARAAGS